MEVIHERKRRKRGVALRVLGVLLAIYVGSYVGWTRPRYAEADREIGAGAFAYVPASWIPGCRNDHLGWHVHMALFFLYAPANLVDRGLFGGRYPLTCCLHMCPPPDR